MKPILRFTSLIATIFFCTQILFAAPDRLLGMGVVEVNHYQLAGAEYWPFYDNEPFRYPSDVLWGFYPEGASPQALKCAEASYRVLLNFFRVNPRLMREAVGLGATRKFYMSTNDYASAADDRVRRKARMWHWNPGAKDYHLGYWKWESTLNPAGECEIPSAHQVNKELREAIWFLDRMD